jgi:hypothetical protein
MLSVSLCDDALYTGPLLQRNMATYGEVMAKLEEA